MKTALRFLVVLSSVYLMITGFAVGQVPQLINYQGVLMDPGTGQPVADATYSISFSLYDVASGGSAIWTESQSVQTKDGLYSVLLGSTSPLTPTILSGPEKYLGIKVGSDPEMIPRNRIVSVAFSILSEDADKLDGKHAAEFADTSHIHDDRYYTKSELNTSDGNPPNQGSNRVSWDNLKDMPGGFADGVDNVGSGGGWIDDGTVVRLETATDSVGIGTVNPSAPFHLYTSQQYGVFKIQSTGTGNGDRGSVDWYTAQNTETWAARIGPSNSSWDQGLIFATSSNNDFDDQDDIVFKPNDTEAMRIKDNGTVQMTGFRLTTSPFDGYVLTSDAEGFGIWQPPSSGLILPYLASTSSDNDAFSITNYGLGRSGNFSIDNPSSNQRALEGSTNGIGAAIFGYTSGTGHAASFTIANTTNSSDAVFANTTGLGRAGMFAIDNTTNDQAALAGSTVGNGVAVFGYTSGLGGAASFDIRNPSNSNVAVSAFTDGMGQAGNFWIYNTSNSEPALSASTNGSGVAILGWINGNGRAGSFLIDNTDNNQVAIEGSTNGSGDAIRGYTNGTARAGYFEINNSNNSSRALESYTNGTGEAAFFGIDNASSSSAAVSAATNGTGVAGFFAVRNINNTEPALGAQTDGSGPAINGYTNGTGKAGNFMIANIDNSSPTLYAYTNGTGAAGYFRNTNNNANEPTIDAATSGNFAALYGYCSGTGKAGYFIIDNANNDNDGISVTTNGIGRAGYFEINNSNSNNKALEGWTNGSGVAIYGNNSGSGTAGDFNISNSSNNQAALQAATVGTGHAGTFTINNPTSVHAALATFNNGSGSSLLSENSGTGPGGYFEINNSSNTQPVITASTNGSGPAVAGHTSGTGVAGDFGISNPSSIEPALRAWNQGTGSAFLANHSGSSGDIAIFQSDGSNQARIDKTGKGFFNGGTQTGGADLAEALEVVDDVQNYEPGDVLVISTNNDSKFEKSSNVYSTLVAGVYATKPGVLLCDRHIDDGLDDTIPVGIVGIIPTKVSGENGPIKRGDLLVTSNTPGHAMKGTDRDQMLGAIIGKALENFEGSGTGVIKVLVNVK